jgi:hypothetical protein
MSARTVLSLQCVVLRAIEIVAPRKRELPPPNLPEDVEVEAGQAAPDIAAAGCG